MIGRENDLMIERFLLVYGEEKLRLKEDVDILLMWCQFLGGISSPTGLQEKIKFHETRSSPQVLIAEAKESWKRKWEEPLAQARATVAERLRLYEHEAEEIDKLIAQQQPGRFSAALMQELELRQGYVLLLVHHTNQLI